ncbi:hypothetical protein M3J09_006649 [Ascochyta lentis]
MSHCSHSLERRILCCPKRPWLGSERAVGQRAVRMAAQRVHIWYWRQICGAFSPMSDPPGGYLGLSTSSTPPLWILQTSYKKEETFVAALCGR